MLTFKVSEKVFFDLLSGDQPALFLNKNESNTKLLKRAWQGGVPSNRPCTVQIVYSDKNGCTSTADMHCIVDEGNGERIYNTKANKEYYKLIPDAFNNTVIEFCGR